MSSSKWRPASSAAPLTNSPVFGVGVAKGNEVPTKICHRMPPFQQPHEPRGRGRIFSRAPGVHLPPIAAALDFNIDFVHLLWFLCGSPISKGLRVVHGANHARGYVNGRAQAGVLTRKARGAGQRETAKRPAHLGRKSGQTNRKLRVLWSCALVSKSASRVNPARRRFRRAGNSLARQCSQGRVSDQEKISECI